jgi:leucyl-tRNA synthetase
MSKSKKNVVDPQELIDRYGADTVRMFCLFASPPERDLEWNDQGVEGAYRFLGRIWRLVMDHLEPIRATSHLDRGAALAGDMKALHRKTHETIRRVTFDIEDRFHFNTAVSAVMELVNETQRLLGSELKRDETFWKVVREAVETTVILLSPVAPHMAEELWERLGHAPSLIEETWPAFEEEALEKEKRVVVLQVNGKVRSRIEVPSEFTDAQVEAEALANDRLRQFVGGKPIRKVIVVKNKLVNVVI